MLTILFLAQFIFYLVLFLLNDYLGTVLSLIMGSICLALWVLSRVVEWIQASRVSKVFYRAMFLSALAPLAAILLYGLSRGGFDWMDL